MEYTHVWDARYRDKKGQMQYRKFNLGNCEMHFDFADKPGMVHEYVSKPFNLENGEYNEKFVDDIFNSDKHKAIEYFDTKRLEDLTLTQLRTLCSHMQIRNKNKNKKRKDETKNQIISDILKYERMGRIR